MQLTIDSSQKLDDVIRVVGALYKVQLRVVGSGEKAAIAPPRSRGRSAGPRSSAARRSGRRPARRNTSTADVRAWAHTNGYQISDRGRIPTNVKDAFAASQG